MFLNLVGPTCGLGRGGYWSRLMPDHTQIGTSIRGSSSMPRLVRFRAGHISAAVLQFCLRYWGTWLYSDRYQHKRFSLSAAVGEV